MLLHQGVVPNVNLAMSIGIEHRWDDTQLCFCPVLTEDGNGSVDGIALAGDGAGIGGAWVAEARGRVAGFAAIRALMPSFQVEDGPVRRRLARFGEGRAFLDRLYRPAEDFRRPTGDTIACRCEEVTAAQITDTVALGCLGPNQMKSFLRCGMGPCQGRLCGLTVTELIAQARGVSPQAVGYYRLRPPVKPITLAELAALPKERIGPPLGRAGLMTQPDVLVIGGGLHGCSTALHLARRGVSVAVLEKDYVGRHASGVNAGGVRRLGRHLAEVPLSVASMETWHAIRDLVDNDCGFESHGQVKVAENEAELRHPPSPRQPALRARLLA